MKSMKFLHSMTLRERLAYRKQKGLSEGEVDPEYREWSRDIVRQHPEWVGRPAKWHGNKYPDGRFEPVTQKMLDDGLFPSEWLTEAEGEQA